MNFKRFMLVLSMALGLATPAQSQRLVSNPPNCALSQRMYDNLLVDRWGWTMRRYEWHAMYAGASMVTAYEIHKVTRLPELPSAILATVAVGLVPHIQGALHRTYQIDLRDWAFDLWNRSAPVWYVIGKRSSPTLATTTYVAGYFALACYASP